jgi:hypothetical protein
MNVVKTALHLFSVISESRLITVSRIYSNLNNNWVVFNAKSNSISAISGCANTQTKQTKCIHLPFSWLNTDKACHYIYIYIYKSPNMSLMNWLQNTLLYVSKQSYNDDRYQQDHDYIKRHGSYQFCSRGHYSVKNTSTGTRLYCLLSS